MKRKILILVVVLSNLIFSHENLTGIIKGQDPDGISTLLVGANIIWIGTTIGTTSDLNGRFEIPFAKESNILLVSYIGFKSEELTITNQNEIEITLAPEAKEISDVEILENSPSIQIDYLGIENKSILTSKELQKAACCTLAESFETNPSIDVSFTDAITGMRQIEMLGLAGMYTQTTMEALPSIRGLTSNVGLSFVPGPWINAINVSKGVGSVANGYESITGQIDIGMQKPFGIEGEKPFYLNLYGDYEQRFEGNLNYRYTLSNNLSSVNLLHASSRNESKDSNSDLFMDLPTFQTFNIMQRWQYLSFDGWESQLGFHLVSDKKEGGTINSSDNSLPIYKFGSTSKMFNVYGKTGYVFPEDNHRSFGLQWSFNYYDNSSNYGSKTYEGKEKNLYLNFIYQTDIFNESNLIRTGISFVYDEFDESFINEEYDRIERVPGAFLEYTFKPNDEFSLVTGLRGDIHNQFGFFLTPRLHARYSPHPDWVLRAAIGKGYRISNIFTEYSSSFVSSRRINISSTNDFGSGLDQESAWNYGFNLTHYFLFDYRDATISFDFYRTDFDNTTIADLDSSPQSINFSSIGNGAYSNTFQAELNIEPILFFNARLAYKYIDSKQLINESWLEKPFTAKHRALVNIAYKTEKVEMDDPQMSYDITFLWFGNKRIPSTESNPVEFRARETSPSFVLINAQMTRSFSELFDFYIGVENLLDFTQNEPIIDPQNPDGLYFDASLIWGPVTGRMIYAGLRYRI
jgi:hypothetical protein